MAAASLEEGINPRQGSSCKKNGGIQGILPQSAAYPSPLLSSEDVTLCWPVAMTLWMAAHEWPEPYWGPGPMSLVQTQSHLHTHTHTHTWTTQATTYCGEVRPSWWDQSWSLAGHLLLFAGFHYSWLDFNMFSSLSLNSSARPPLSVSRSLSCHMWASQYSFIRKLGSWQMSSLQDGGRGWVPCTHTMWKLLHPQPGAAERCSVFPLSPSAPPLFAFQQRPTEILMNPIWPLGAVSAASFSAPLELHSRRADFTWCGRVCCVRHQLVSQTPVGWEPEMKPWCWPDREGAL